MSTVLFGTDGIRGVAGQAPLDPSTLTRLGSALVRAVAASSPVRVLIGRDTRESGVWIESDLARGMRAEGAQVTSVGVVSTPAVAYLAQALGSDLGIVISASHNLYQDNGIKVFAGDGHKFGEAQERAVEALLAAPAFAPSKDAPKPEPRAGASAPSTGSGQAGKPVAPVVPVDLVDRYLDHVRRILPAAAALAGVRLGIDMANGATTTTAPRFLRALGCELVEIGNAPDGRNINLDCGSTHPARLRALVVEHQCHMGVAFDGDGDRAIFVDHLGRVVDGDAVLLVLARRLQERGTLAGRTVVATVMSNLGLEKALDRIGVRLVRTAVGDKFVRDEMMAHGYVLGGEQSGHMIMADHLYTGDGLATALAVLRVMNESGRDLADLASAFVPYPQVLLNVRVRERRALAEVPAIAAAMAGVEAALAGRGRLLVRYSGTEPLLRIMIEAEDGAAIQRWAEDIADAARAALGEA